ncbi:uncharacterized protein VTP21DRAFT_4836 [Calcarisporiella thermophila]|uniref:uncharacterized protein n=1 Tax=Calcarisporiella thermophila TaxID=911321 RepID=UPI00374317D8
MASQSFDFEGVHVKTGGVMIGGNIHVSRDTYIGLASLGNLPPKERFRIPRMNHSYVERPSLQKKFVDVFDPKSSAGCKFLVLNGLKGMGKSQLMLWYCHNANHGVYDYAFWLQADDWETTVEAFRDLAIQLGLNPTEREANEGHSINWVRLWLQENCRKRWLLLLDNIDNATFRKLSDLLFGSCKGGDILISACEYLHGELGLWNVMRVKVGAMREDEAVSLLLRFKITDWSSQRF